MAIHDPGLLDALEALGASAYEGVVWRHMFNEHPPELANTGGARWNPAGIAAVYTSEASQTALEEAQRAIDIQPLRPKARRRVLYELRVQLSQVVDLTGGRHLAVGLTNDDLTSDDFTHCQTVGAAVAWLGYDGILVPSARHQGRNVVILIDALDPDTALERLHQSEVDEGTQ